MIRVVVGSNNDAVVDVLRVIGENINQHPNIRRLEVLDVYLLEVFLPSLLRSPISLRWACMLSDKRRPQARTRLEPT